MFSRILSELMYKKTFRIGNKVYDYPVNTILIKELRRQFKNKEQKYMDLLYNIRLWAKFNGEKNIEKQIDIIVDKIIFNQ